MTNMTNMTDNSIQSIEDIKTSIMGYDKELVLEYVRNLLKQMEEEKKAELKDHTEREKRLEVEKEKLESQVMVFRENHEELRRQLEDMTRAWEKNAQYSARRDEMLHEYQKKEAEIAEMLEQASKDAQAVIQEAEETRKRMLKDTKEACEELSGRERERLRYYNMELRRLAKSLLPVLNEKEEIITGLTVMIEGEQERLPHERKVL